MELVVVALFVSAIDFGVTYAAEELRGGDENWTKFKGFGRLAFQWARERERE